MNLFIIIILFLVTCGLSHFVEEAWHPEYVQNGNSFVSFVLSIAYDLLTFGRVYLFVLFGIKMGWFHFG